MRLSILLLFALGLEASSGQGTVQFLNNALSRVLYQPDSASAIIPAPMGTKIGLSWGVDSNNLSLVSPTASIGFSPGIWNGGAGAISVCDQSSLRTAVQAGGLIRFCCDGTITLTNTLEITRDVALDARGHVVTIDGGQNVRLFIVRPGVTFAVTNLTLANGYHRGMDGAILTGQVGPVVPQVGTPGEGGALLNQGGNVILTSVILTGNGAEGGIGGSVSGTDGISVGKSGPGRGGAIANREGTLRLLDVTLSDNAAQGGLDPRSTAPPGRAGDGLGGTIYSTNGLLEVRTATFADNLALAPGGGTEGANAKGGSLFVEAGTLKIWDSIFTTNEAVGGSPFISPLFADSSRRPGNGYGGAMGASDAAVFLEAVRFSFNRAVGGPGVRFSGNGEAQGGSVHITGSSFVHAVDCVFRGNAAVVSTGSYGADGRGGAVFAGGILLMSQCSVIANQARGSDGWPVSLGVAAAGHGFGGGICSTGQVCLTNCTIAGNSAQGGSAGSGIAGQGQRGDAYGGGYFVGGGSLTAMNSTLASNVVMSGTGTDPVRPPILVGANIANSFGTVTLRNTILARGGTAQNVWGMVSDAGANLSSDDSPNFTSPGSINNTDPRLGPLGDNYGGMTPLMPLKPDSPAKDAGTSAGAPPIDQRGAARPFGAGFDMGAYEYHSNLAEPAQLTIIPGNGVFTLQFEARPEATYQLQTSSTEGIWTDVESFGPYPISIAIARTFPLNDDTYRAFRTLSSSP